ncbi:GMC family oxidoreductase [Paenibacillus alkaliterrae]|uniref:GMC oxidoreductase n=1 Tax=Paenibacillus alkaliterrae TaxID=320909 RepID=UPI001F396FD8|nr:GMC family oxidoreductase [Paenibacillus alkaliterrae]MCF2938504.1 GMC family oxidoreductase [Paenibacillus alkaliterrae]
MWVYPNNWIPDKSLEQMANTKYDVLIVGSGAGGGATLYRLCELWRNQGAKRIGILEKGNKLFHSHALNIPTMNVSRMRDQLWPDNSTHVGARLPQFPGARQTFALGGRTLFWNAGCPRPPQFEIQQWPVNSEEMDVYFRLAETIMNVTTSYAQGSSMQKVLMNRLHANHIPEATDFPLAIDMRGSRKGEIHSNAWFSSVYFLAYAMNDRPFDLALNAYTTRVLLENGKAAGVNVMSPDKKIHTIRAKNVVVSASTLETPRLFLNSGIQGPAIGRFLTNHSFVLGTGKISRRLFSDNIGNLAILKRETRQAPYQIQILGPDQYISYQQFEEKVLQEELGVVLVAFGRVEPRYENKVYLDPSARDEYGVPMIQVNFSYNERDNAVINQMRQGIIQSASAMGVTLDGGPTLLPPGSDLHESCTSRMGNDPATSSTDRFGQIHDVSGLYVADNSVLPTLAAANPTLSTIALAIRTADHIVRQSG